MKTFNVYKHPIQGVEAVKVGFSWPALFFGGFWMLFNKMWKPAGLWFLINSAAVLFQEVTHNSQTRVAQALSGLLLLAVGLALYLVPAFKGNKWREANLSKRGYSLLQTMQAESPYAAISKVEEYHRK